MSKKKKWVLEELNKKYGYGSHADELDVPESLVRGPEWRIEARWPSFGNRELVRAYDHPEAMMKLWLRKDPPLSQDEKDEIIAGIVRVLVPPGTSVDFSLSGLNIYVNDEHVVWDNSSTRIAIENEGE